MFIILILDFSNETLSTDERDILRKLAAVKSSWNKTIVVLDNGLNAVPNFKSSKKIKNYYKHWTWYKENKVKLAYNACRFSGSLMNVDIQIIESDTTAEFNEP
eukprot:UN05937